MSAPFRCDLGDECPGHASPDERPCGWEPPEATEPVCMKAGAERELNARCAIDAIMELRESLRETEKELAEVQAEVASMRPVIETVNAWSRDQFSLDAVDQAFRELESAIHAYRAAEKQEKSDD